MKSHDILLALGVASFVVLFLRKGLDWTIDFTLSFFVAITIFNWLQKRFFS